MREAAKYKIFHDSEVDKIDEKIKKLQGGGGFFGFFSSGPNEEQKKEIQALNEQKKKLLKKNVNEGMKELLNKESSDEIDTMKDIPDNFCLYRVILNLPNFSLENFSPSIISNTRLAEKLNDFITSTNCTK